MIDELTFVREKLRREVQELLNFLDAATSAATDKERLTADTQAFASTILMGKTVAEYTAEIAGAADALRKKD